MTEDLGPRIEAAWSRSDLLFSLIAEATLYERPIRLRQPLIFYLGHLPAFAWNQAGAGALARPSFRADFDRLFERGIDPPDTGDGPDDRLAWPDTDEVRAYRDRVREELRPVLDDPRLRSTALMLVHAFDRRSEASALEDAIDTALRESPTPDLGGQATTAEFTDAVVRAVA